MRKVKYSVLVLCALLIFAMSGCVVKVDNTETTAAATTAATTAASGAEGEIWSYFGGEMKNLSVDITENKITQMTYFFAGEGGITNYPVTDKAMIKKVYDALNQITVAGETLTAAEDYTDGFTFLKDDGTQYHIVFNMRNLEVNNHYYLIDNASTLWVTVNEITATVPPVTEGGTETTTAPTTEAPTPPDEDDNIEEYEYGMWEWTIKSYGDQSFEFVIDDHVVIPIPSSWYNRVVYNIEDEESLFFNFYHEASYEKYEEAYDSPGGFLFGIAYYADESYKDLPSYQYLGAAEGGYYVMVFPTDVQGWMDDADIWADWQMVQGEMDFVSTNTKFR